MILKSLKKGYLLCLSGRTWLATDLTWYSEKGEHIIFSHTVHLYSPFPWNAPEMLHLLTKEKGWNSNESFQGVSGVCGVGGWGVQEDRRKHWLCLFQREVPMMSQLHQPKKHPPCSPSDTHVNCMTRKCVITRHKSERWYASTGESLMVQLSWQPPQTKCLNTSPKLNNIKKWASYSDSLPLKNDHDFLKVL